MFETGVVYEREQKGPCHATRTRALFTLREHLPPVAWLEPALLLRVFSSRTSMHTSTHTSIHTSGRAELELELAEKKKAAAQVGAAAMAEQAKRAAEAPPPAAAPAAPAEGGE